MLQKYYNHEELSRKLNQIIVDNRHTIASLSKEAGIPDSTLRNLCDPKTKFNPGLATLHKLSKALGIDLTDELFKGD